MQVVVVRILRHPSIEICTCQDVHGVLLVFNGFDSNLGQEVVVKHVRRQVRLDRETISKELLVKVLVRLLAHEMQRLLQGSTGAAHHLQDIINKMTDYEC
jgi:nitrogen-specific signal transduction histidine kinase